MSLTRAELDAALAPLLAELRLLRQAFLPPDELVQEVCTHPDDKRVSLTGASGAVEWVCRDCGYRHVEER